MREFGARATDERLGGFLEQSGRFTGGVLHDLAAGGIGRFAADARESQRRAIHERRMTARVLQHDWVARAHRIQ